MKSQTVHGIVIRTTPYGDIHKVVTLLTKELGKITVMAHGARKTKGKLAAVTQVFSNATFLVVESRKGGMGTLKQGETKVRYKKFTGDIEKTTFASIIIELANYLTEDSDLETASKVFDIVERALQLIEAGKDAQSICLLVEMNLLEIAGIHPEINGCSCCNERSGDFAFSIKYQGFICHRCFKQDRYRMPVTKKTIAIFCFMLGADIFNVESIEASDQTKFEINKILAAFYNEYAGITIRAKKMIESLQKTRPIA